MYLGKWESATMKIAAYRSLGAVVLLCLVLVLMNSVPVLAGGPERDSEVTFSREIAPILQRSCQNCHRPGGTAPMSLVNYSEVRPWARSIKNRTQVREMPPWFIDKNIGIQQFKDDPSLTDQEIELIGRWVDTGALEGDPSDMPPPIDLSEAEWGIGDPDLIVSSPVGTVPANAADWFGEWDPPTPTGLSVDRYIKAVEVKEVRVAGNNNQRKVASGKKGVGRADLNLWVIHHAVITAASPEQAEVSNGPVTDGDYPFRLTWELGQNAMVFPDPVGVSLPANSVVTFDSMHLHSIGEEVQARVDVAFKLHPEGYEPKYKQSTRAMSGAFDFALDIPSNDDNVYRDGFYRVTEPALMVTFEPHLHSSGRRMCIEALYPNNTREMLNCADYDHNWVKVYAYEDGVAPLLPAGTIVHLMAWYDNSVTNKNVVDPRNWKGWGNRSIDDMFYNLPRLVYLTEDEFSAEVAKRDGTPMFTTSTN
tara:strand:- start:31722 stop:33155 length:1434 start_codon:yes stop_codon:yes gene_type:complete